MTFRLRDVGDIATRVLVVLTTLLFLASMGGGMAYAAPILVPLHWWIARTATWGRFGWFFLAFLSTAEAFAIYAYLAVGYFSWLIGLAAGAFVMLVFYLSLRPLTQRRANQVG